MTKLSLRGKLLCVLGMLSVVAVIISVIGITKLSGMNDRLEGIVNVSAAKVNLSNDMNADLLTVATNVRNLILATTQEEMDKYAGVIDNAAARLKNECEELDKIVDGQGKQTLAKFTKEMDQYLAVIGQVRELSRKNSNVRATQLSQTDARQAFEEVAAKAEALAEKNEAALLASLKNANMTTEADQARKALLALRIESGLVEIQRAEKNIILAKTEEEMDAFAKAIAKTRADIEKKTSELGALLDDDNKSLYNEFTSSYDRWIALHQQVRQLARENSNVKAFDLAATAGNQSLAKLDEIVTAFVDKNVQQMEQDKAASAANYASAKWMMILTSAVGCGAALILGLLIITGVNRTLTRIVGALSAGSEQTAAASSQVSASSQSLAEGASEQAAALEETSSSLEEMSSMTKRNAASAEEAKNLAAEAKSSAENGNTAMGRMSTAINDIQQSSAETAKIIKVIDEIAFQTNLLALNAAVEAARAGEAGKGFAVVAEEVRNLAMRSADAAKNTSELIEDSVKRSENGVGIAGEVAKMLGEISTSVVKVNDLVAEITAASQEQAQGIEQVNVAVSQMDKVTQQTAANAEESASASEELNAQAEQLSQIVGELSAVIGGAATEHAAGTAYRSHPSSRPAEKKNTRRIANSTTTEAHENVAVHKEAVTVGQDFSEFGTM